MERVAIYLRKSRADIELESDEDTLSKHRRALLKFAKDKSMNIVQIYEEVVSGERISNRPEMQRLLADVENGLYEAVLVMDMDRLGRGNMQEQGLIIDTFRESNTLIVTPRKTYNLRNEFDEEYSEFEAFMARKELKIITRRLQSGRTRSAQDGNYLCNLPPYGYIIHKPDNQTRTLLPHPEQADVVRLIFNLYTNERMGIQKISDHLNTLGIKGYRGDSWNSKRVHKLLKKTVYIGLIAWNQHRSKPHPEPDKKIKKTKRPLEETILVPGRHPPLITKEQFEMAQRMMTERYIPSTRKDKLTKNPLAGLMVCGLCGWKMVRIAKTIERSYIKCNNTNCTNRAVKTGRVEKEIVQELEKLMERYKVTLKDRNHDNGWETAKNMLKAALQEWNELKRQKDNLHDLLERGVYSVEMYLERSQHLASRIKEKETAIDALRTDADKKEREQKTRRDFLPALINVMKLYHKTKSDEQKNRLLKSVLHHAVLKKENEEFNGFFELVLYPKLPE